MVEVKIQDSALAQAAQEGIDTFLDLIIEKTREAIGGELTAENMSQMSSKQITLVGYAILRDEVMDGGFIQLIHNGYGPFFFRNPFDTAMRQWGAAVQELTGIRGNEDTNLIGLCRLLRKARKCYQKYHEQIEADMDYDEFMAMYESLDAFEDFDDEFVSNEESYSEDVARYVDENLTEFVRIEN